MKKQEEYLKEKELEFEGIMQSYLNVKRESLNLGFDEFKGITFRDFLDVYLQEKKKK